MNSMKPLDDMTKHEYTVTGIIRMSTDLPVAEIGEALMDSAAELNPDTAVSIDLGQATVEIECLVMGDGVVDAMARGKTLIHRICNDAELPVQFADGRKPHASEWRVIDESAEQPTLLSA